MNFHLRTTAIVVAAIVFLAPGAPAQVPLQVAPPSQESPKPTISISISADFLALHVEIKTPEGADEVQYRFGELTEIPEGADWKDAGVPIGEDRTLHLEIPLPDSRWKEFQARAMKGTEVLATSTKRYKPRAFTLVTPERIAVLPESQRAPWLAYVEKSARFAAAEYDVLSAECRAGKLPKSQPAPSGDQFLIGNNTSEIWLKGEEAARLADAVISFQTPTGGWSKAVSYQKGPRQPGMHWTTNPGDPWHYCGTIDNGATTSQIRFLATIYTATGREDARAAVLRGIEWLLAAQFPNGGWPQNYPLEPDYHEAITLNDNAMTVALKLVLDASKGEAPFAFLDESLRRRLRKAFDHGIDCLFAAQVVLEGKRTVWCAQHDPLTLEPARARRMEPPALSGGESAELLKFLMREGPLTEQIVTMIEPAVAWLDTHRIAGLKKTISQAGYTDYVDDPQSEEVYWARFYDPATAKPIFPGYEDSFIYGTFSEMAAKNRVGYAYLVTRPGEVIEKELPRWKRRMAKEGFTPSSLKPSP